MIGQPIIEALALLSIATPVALLALLGIPSLLARPMSETFVGSVTRVAMLGIFVSTCLALLLLLLRGGAGWVASFGTWFGTATHGYSFDLRIDALSLGFAALAAAAAGVDAAFSYRYLHREPGYNRYFVLFAVFVLGIMLIALAGSIEVLFTGWELLGLSSALLVGFFHERRAPVQNALRVFAVYRVSDAAMLAAAVLMHHWAGSGSLSLVFASTDSAAASGLGPTQASVIAGLLLLAVVGKSALLPLSGWLPRAMEGPTSSSAVFYGSLSIHAGCFLLLRAEPLLEHTPVIRALAIAAGVATALHATASARVQTDVKSALTYAALTQVGLIVVEIGLGLTTIAFIHMLGHACFRLLQFLSAPSILHDLHELENAIGGRVEAGAGSGIDRPLRRRRWLYLWAVERGFVDPLLERVLIDPFVTVARALDRFDRLLCGDAKLAREAAPSREQDGGADG